MSVPGAAEAYDHHVGSYGSQLAAGLIDAAGVRGGQRVLDDGCGPVGSPPRRRGWSAPRT